MEQEKINIAALLKDCPKGTKLYSPICGECEFDGIGYEKHFIYTTANGKGAIFNMYGEFLSYKDGERLLFPSKDVRSWGCFRAKYAKGVEGKDEEIKALLESNGGIDNRGSDFGGGRYVYYIDRIDNNIKVVPLSANDNTFAYVLANYILSTGTELKLEEEQKPKFKVGDVVKDNIGHLYCLVDEIRHSIKGMATAELRMECRLDTTNTLATEEEIAKWNEETLHPNHLHYSKSKRDIIPWFLPFAKVVVRYAKGNIWTVEFFSCYNHKNKSYVGIGGVYEYCLPYNEETARLIGTTDDYKEERQ